MLLLQNNLVVFLRVADAIAIIEIRHCLFEGWLDLSKTVSQFTTSFFLFFFHFWRPFRFDYP